MWYSDFKNIGIFLTCLEDIFALRIPTVFPDVLVSGKYS